MSDTTAPTTTAEAEAASAPTTTSTADTVPAPTPTPGASEAASGISTPSVLAHRAVRAVISSLSAAGVANADNLIRVLPDTAPTAAAAAAQLDCPVAAIANSLMFEAAGQPLLVLTSGGHRVDTKALGPRVGLSKSAIKRAKPDFVKLHTGQTIGGVAPVGHPAPIRTLVDEELKNYEVVWAAGGHHMAVFPIDFETLVRITNGTVVKVD